MMGIQINKVGTLRIDCTKQIVKNNFDKAILSSVNLSKHYRAHEIVFVVEKGKWNQQLIFYKLILLKAFDFNS